MSGTMDVVLDTEISNVTVYPDRARLTLSGRLELSPGRQKAAFDELPLSLLPESVRVSGRGAAKVRLHGVEVRRAHYERTPLKKASELELEIERLEDEVRELVDEQAVLKAQGEYLDGLRKASKQYARGLAFGRTKVEDQAALARYLQESDSQLRLESRDLDKRKRGLERQLNKLRRELNELRSSRPKERYQAVIDLEVLSGGAFTPEITYVVTGAGWQPLYDVRLFEEEGGKLEVTNIAQVTQRTGQDWQGVELTVSTARPAVSQQLPELKPWYIDEYRPPEIAPRRLRAVTAQAQLASVEDVMMDPAPSPIAETPLETEAATALAEVRESETVVSYKVSGESNIPSDGSPHKVTISHSQMDPALDYLAVPKYTDAVFRRVKALNGGPGPMLSGPINLFVGEEFVGSNRLDYVPMGDEMEILIGVEERITIERELTRRDVDKKRLRDRRQLQYGYKIELKNLLPAGVQVEVHDHIPVARHEEIRVKLLQFEPEPVEHSDLNLFEWQITVPAGQERTISYDFMVEHPRDLKIIGLVD